MKYTKFEITNFKGINHLILDLEKLPQGKIFPLVGLNESGKTTILEAISLFQNKITDEDAHKLIHKNKKGDFDKSIEIKATLKLDEADNNFIVEFLKEKKLELEKNIEFISITRKYEFKDAVFAKYTPAEWNTVITVKTKQAKNFVKLVDKNSDIWSELTSTIENEFLPKILYFENFLFDFPEKIYLESVDNSELTKTETQLEYRKVLQDILSSIDKKNYDLNTHILSKLKNPSDQNEESVKQVINDMCKKLNDTIIKSWQDIFKKSTEKSVEIEYKNDANKYYLQFKIKEGSSSFYINERSLGFRWFFGFLIFTEFRKARRNESGEYLFLFDEPANNLHQKSQQKLLEQFEKLTDKSKIIYSTHSHCLLSPKFLLTSFVVIDRGRKEDKNGEIDLENYSQDIDAELYKNFVANSKNEETHFQPLLDCLEYIENPFEKISNMVFFEGKSDYYIFKWIKEKFFNNKYNFRFYPGAGVDKYENLFREYLANNKNFIAIFDGDSAGKGARQRYLEKVSQELEKNIFTLKDVKESFDDFQTERLFDTEAERLKIQKLSFPDSMEYKKGEFNTGVQQLFIEDRNFELSIETKENFKKVFDFIKSKFADLEN